MYIGLRVKYPLFLLYFDESWIFVVIFSKNIQVSNFMKISSFAVELFHVKEQPDITTLIQAFCNFAKAPKK
jgi:hypothetical protein